MHSKIDIMGVFQRGEKSFPKMLTILAKILILFKCYELKTYRFQPLVRKGGPDEFNRLKGKECEMFGLKYTSYFSFYTCKIYRYNI